MAPFVLYVFGHLAEMARAGGSAQPDFSEFTRLQGLSNLVSLASLVVGAVVYCAVIRSVLFPEARRYAYLRLGMAELFMIAWWFGAGIAAAVAIVPAVLVIALVVMLSSVAHAAAVGGLFAVGAVVALVVGFAYVFLRMAMVGPMTVRDGKFHLVDAWELGRGHVVDFFVILLGVFLILMVVELVIGGFMFVFGAGMLGQAAGGLDHLQEFFRQPSAVIIASLLRAFTPLLAVVGVLAIPLSGCLLAVVFAPWARAYRDIIGPEPAASSV
jgi:hypothetical protein